MEGYVYHPVMMGIPHYCCYCHGHYDESVMANEQHNHQHFQHQIPQYNQGSFNEPEVTPTFRKNKRSLKLTSKQECSKNFYGNSNLQARAESVHTDRHTETTSNLEEFRAKSPPMTERYPIQHLPIAANPNEIPQFQPVENPMNLLR